MRKHPIVEFMKYVFLIILIMCTLHPVSLIILTVLSLYITKFKLWLVDLWILFAMLFIYSFSSVDGVTFIAYHNYHIITLEAIVYGLLMGMRLIIATSFLWKFSQDVKSDKLVVVTSYLAPPLSLLISMTVRNIRRYTDKLKEIYKFHYSLLQKPHFYSKFSVAVKSLSILIDWALENGMETISSMENRKYGSHRRTSYKVISLSIKDVLEVIVQAVFLILYLVTRPYMNIIPEIEITFSYFNLALLLIIITYVIVEEYFEAKVRRDNI